MLDQIFSYQEMCAREHVQVLQRGMNFRLNPEYSVVLMSRKSNAPYRDHIHADGITVEYEGHDEPRIGFTQDPKKLDQPRLTSNGSLTQNGKFIDAVEKYKAGNSKPESVKVYEKIFAGVWSLKGFFDLLDFQVRHDGQRDAFVFLLRLSQNQQQAGNVAFDLKHTRLIPSDVKKEVWKRDGGQCVECGSKVNLHFDHDLPFSKGGASITTKNIRLLCAKHNLAKSDNIQ